MQAPIPSPHSDQIARVDKPRPKGLNSTTLLMCVFNLCAYSFTSPDLGPLSLQLLVTTIIVLISFVVLWFFWNGHNWARILVLLTSVLTLVNLFLLGSSSIVSKTIILAEAALGIFLLYWLNTKLLRDYFKR